MASKSRDVIDDSPERTVSRRSSAKNEEEQKLPAKVYAFEAKSKTLSSSSARSIPLPLSKLTSKVDRITQLQQSSGDYHKIRKAFPSQRPSFQPQSAPHPPRLQPHIGKEQTKSSFYRDQATHVLKQQKPQEQNHKHYDGSIDNSETTTESNKRQQFNSRGVHASSSSEAQSSCKNSVLNSDSFCRAGRSENYETDRSEKTNNFVRNLQSNNFQTDAPQAAAASTARSVTATTTTAAASAAASAAPASAAPAITSNLRNEALSGIKGLAQLGGPQKLQNFSSVERYSQIPARSAQYHSAQIGAGTGTSNISRLDSSGKTVESDGPRSNNRYQNVGAQNVPSSYGAQDMTKALHVVNNDNFVRNNSKNKGGTCKAGRPKSSLAAKMKRRRDIGDRREQSRDDDRKTAGTYGANANSQGQWQSQVGGLNFSN